MHANLIQESVDRERGRSALGAATDGLLPRIVRRRTFAGARVRARVGAGIVRFGEWLMPPCDQASPKLAVAPRHPGRRGP